MPLAFLILAFSTGLAAAAVWLLTGGSILGASVVYILGGNSIMLPLLPILLKAANRSM